MKQILSIIIIFLTAFPPLSAQFIDIFNFDYITLDKTGVNGWHTVPMMEMVLLEYLMIQEMINKKPKIMK